MEPINPREKEANLLSIRNRIRSNVNDVIDILNFRDMSKEDFDLIQSKLQKSLVLTSKLYDLFCKYQDKESI